VAAGVSQLPVVQVAESQEGIHGSFFVIIRQQLSVSVGKGIFSPERIFLKGLLFRVSFFQLLVTALSPN
jgi:hypothetical protein